MKMTVDFLKTAREHRKADADCGRVWTCGCVACLKVKDAAPELLDAVKAAIYHIQNIWAVMDQAEIDQNSGGEKELFARLTSARDKITPKPRTGRRKA